jgi:hypothetical protein
VLLCAASYRRIWLRLSFHGRLLLWLSCKAFADLLKSAAASVGLVMLMLLVLRGTNLAG